MLHIMETEIHLRFPFNPKNCQCSLLFLSTSIYNADCMKFMECVHSVGNLSQHTAGGSYPLLKVVIKQSCCHFSLIVAVIMNNSSWQHLLIRYNSCQSLCSVWLQCFCACQHCAINYVYEFCVINSPNMGLVQICYKMCISICIGSKGCAQTIFIRKSSGLAYFRPCSYFAFSILHPFFFITAKTTNEQAEKLQSVKWP